MFASNTVKIIDIWEKKILQGISIHICYDRLANDLSNHEVDYFFFTNKYNTCFRDWDTLGHKFINDSQLASIFEVIQNEKMIWNMGALKEWLQDYAEFQGLLCICSETLSGSPG